MDRQVLECLYYNSGFAHISVNLRCCHRFKQSLNSCNFYPRLEVVLISISLWKFIPKVLADFDFQLKYVSVQYTIFECFNELSSSIVDFKVLRFNPDSTELYLT